MSKFACICVRAGAERKTVDYINQMWPEVDATGLERGFYRSVNGARHTEKQQLMSGYIFLRLHEFPPADELRNILGFVRVLNYQSGEWELAGSDLAFAEYVFANDGVLGVSKACKVGERIRLIERPLKDYEGSILKMDRHRKNGLVEIGYHGRSFQVWLPFDIVQTVEEKAVDHPKTDDGGRK